MLEQSKNVIMALKIQVDKMGNMYHQTEIDSRVERYEKELNGHTSIKTQDQR